MYNGMDDQLWKKSIDDAVCTRASDDQLESSMCSILEAGPLGAIIEWRLLTGSLIMFTRSYQRKGCKDVVESPLRAIRHPCRREISEKV